jgi:hypothetical protein
MRNIFLGIVSACVFAPSIASAALTLNIERIELRPGDTGFIEVFFTESAPAANENLVAYAVGLDLPTNPGNAVSFGPAPLLRETTAHPFVFAPGTPIDDTGSNASRIRSSAAILTAPENIVDNEGVLRVPVTAAMSAVPGSVIPVVFNLTGGLTEFSDDIGGVIEFVPVNGQVTIVPEPAALGLLGIGGVLFLRRRRA